MTTIGNVVTARGNFQHVAADVKALIESVDSGDSVLLPAGNFDLPSGIVIPSGVTVRGVAVAATTLRLLNVTADAILMTMGENSRLEDLALQLTSAQHHDLTCVKFPGTTTATAKLRAATVTVDNSGAGAGTSNARGIHVASTGAPGREITAVRACTVRVLSTGSGAKRGVILDTSACNASLRDVNVLCSGSGGGTFIGAESNFAGSRLTFDSGYIFGDTADISETIATLELGAVQLDHSTANGLGFHNARYSLPFVWGDPGALVGASTRFMRPGSATSAIAEIKHRLAHAACVKTLHIRAQAGPGSTRTDTWTIRKNGVDTLLTGSLTGAETFKVISNISVAFADGDDISCKVVTAAGTGTTDVIVGVELF